MLDALSRIRLALLGSSTSAPVGQWRAGALDDTSSDQMWRAATDSDENMIIDIGSNNYYVPCPGRIFGHGWLQSGASVIAQGLWRYYTGKWQCRLLGQYLRGCACPGCPSIGAEHGGLKACATDSRPGQVDFSGWHSSVKGVVVVRARSCSR